MEKQEHGLVVTANAELTKELKEPAVMAELMRTTFGGFAKKNNGESLVRQACLEAMICGYTFQDIIKKKIYAIPFGDSYSLVQSINDVRTIAEKSGQIGKSAPVYEEDDKGECVTCTVTITRLLGGIKGDYTATVYFNEYYKAGYNGKPSKWDTMPRTMIAKVAEMHALRSAFPEEIKMYIEEEMQKPAENKENLEIEKVKPEIAITTLKKSKTLKDLKKSWETLTRREQGLEAVKKVKESLKESLAEKKVDDIDLDELDKKIK